jgi:hypothetical protein
MMRKLLLEEAPDIPAFEILKSRKGAAMLDASLKCHIFLWVCYTNANITPLQAKSSVIQSD